MNMREELLSKMSDDELVKTIQSVKTMSMMSPVMENAVYYVVQEASKRIDTTNKDLIEFQDYIVELVVKKWERSRT